MLALGAGLGLRSQAMMRLLKGIEESCPIGLGLRSQAMLLRVGYRGVVSHRPRVRVTGNVRITTRAGVQVGSEAYG